MINYCIVTSSQPISDNLIRSIFEDIKFIPTGGITSENYQTYLKLPNVISVGSTKFEF